jgi:hypothetical protein
MAARAFKREASSRADMATRKLSELPEAIHPYLGTEAIPVVQDGETRQVALADMLGEAAILTWLAPYQVSSDASPADNRAALNQAVLDAVSQNRPPVLLLPPGRIPLDGPMVLRRGTRIYGASAADLPIGSELFLADGANSSLIQDEAWPDGERMWECAELAYLRVNGNRVGNPGGGSGIAIHSMGKAAEIRHVVVRNCARYGFEFTGPQDPLTLRNCTVEDNAAGGVRLGGDGPVMIQALTGRGLGRPLLVVETAGAPSILLVGPSASGYRPLIHILDGDPHLTILGGRVQAGAGGGEVVRIEKGGAHVQVIGLQHSGFERLVGDGDEGDGLMADTVGGVALYNSPMRSAERAGAGVVLGGGAAGQSAEPVIFAGAGAPPDELFLPTGSLYLRRDGAEGSTFYVREGGRWVPK